MIKSIAALALLVSTSALADAPHFGRTALATEDGASAQSAFAPDTPKIVLHVEILDMPQDTKIAADWIAVKTDAAPPNFKITSAEKDLDDDVEDDEMSFSLTKPDSGWPVGDYKVDLSIDGKTVKSVPFRIVK